MLLQEGYIGSAGPFLYLILFIQNNKWKVVFNYLRFV